MADAVTDTHSLIWYLEADPQLGMSARETFFACARGEIVVYVPTICLVEIVYLQEKGRIPAGLKSQFDVKLKAGTTGLVLSELSNAIVDALTQIPRAAVPDMPDRIIAATALHLGLPLISKDHKIQVAGIQTIW